MTWVPCDPVGPQNGRDRERRAFPVAVAQGEEATAGLWQGHGQAREQWAKAQSKDREVCRTGVCALHEIGSALERGNEKILQKMF